VFKTGFTIRAERCPNRRGVEEILRYFRKQVSDWNDFLKQAAAGAFQAVYLTGNYPDAWNTDEDAKQIDTIPLRIVQDILPSPIARRANYVVPGVTFAEKSGTYVNHVGLLQNTAWALPPFEGAHVDGQTFHDLSGRRGLYQADEIRRELAAKIPFFARAKEEIPECGLNLVTGKEKRPTTSQLGTVTHPLPTFRAPGSPMLEVEDKLEV